MERTFIPDAIVIGHGLAGLVAAYEITNAGKKVLLLDQETEANLGGQAFWSLGGLFLVNTPEQRRLGIKDSYELALRDWMNTAAFDRAEDEYPKAWAKAYVQFATKEKYTYLQQVGIRITPIVGWAERGDGSASGHGNSIPRFHICWGAGTGVVNAFVAKIAQAKERGLIQFQFRHRITELVRAGNKVVAVKGDVLEDDDKLRGEKTNRHVIRQFEYSAANIVITSGGIGANHPLIRKNWSPKLGNAPAHMVCGVPDYVDGSMIGIAEKIGVRFINKDRMWHYTEGVQNWDPIWTNHGIRILPGPSSIWLDATGKRLPAPFLPGFDTLGTLGYIMNTGYDYSWFILTQKILKKEFALSGSEQNPDIVNRDYKLILKRMFGSKAPEPVEKFKEYGQDFLVADRLEDLVTKMNELQGNQLLDFEVIKHQIEDRDRQLNHDFSKDTQINAIRTGRKYLADRLSRIAKPHKILDPQNVPLIAVKLHILSRKTLGGIQTDLDGRVFDTDGNIIEGLFAAGEASGFGGGGMHGYRALEGTFLGGCIFSGKKVGEYIGKT